MAGPAAAAGAAKAAGAAGGGSTAGGSSAGGAAGAKAAGGNAAKYQGVSRAIEAGSKEQSREEQQDEQAFNLSNPPNVGADLTSSLKLLIFGGGVFIFLVLIIPMMWLNAAQSQCLFNPENAYGATTGSLGGVKGTGVTREELKLIRSHIYAGNKVTEGTYSATVYGQPWDALAGTPDTSTGLELGSPTKGKKKYIVAMDPQLNNYGAFVYIWPNPHNWTGPFVVADTGQDGSDGVDIWEWRGMDQMMKWGRKNVKVSRTPIKDPPSTSGSTAGGAPGPNGFVYPLAKQGERGGGVADHMARAFGNWMSDNAVDLLTPNNTPVVATGTGRITRLSGSSPSYCSNPAGYTIYMKSRGIEFSYMHLNRIDVRPGQRVRAGQVIGLSGSANCVAHLHFAAEYGFNPETITDGASAGGGGTVDVQLLQQKFGIPTDLPPIYIAAAEKYQLGPRGASILAAINRIETNFGELATATSSAGAVGWMQFMPATWAAYGVDGDGDGVKDPTNKFDAIYAAANYLRASGAPGNWHDAIYAYNHAEWYVQDVLKWAAKYFPYLQGGIGEASDCGGGSVSGPANIQEAVTLYEPRKWVPIPAAIGDADEVIDARLLPAATWISKTYGLHITQGGWQPGSPSVSHGWGTALDMVPKGDQSQEGWNKSAMRLAKDLGWTPGCATSGQKPACDLVPAIYNVYYNGFPAHGDPWHNSGGSPHIHIQFECSCTSGGGIGQNIATWVKSFPVGTASGDPPESDRPKRKKKGKNS